MPPPPPTPHTHAPVPEDPPETKRLSLRVMTMPRDTNIYGTIFGGVILSYIDQAGFVEAKRHATLRWVTASVERVDFHAPVISGDIVNLYTRTHRKGTTSITVCVDVDAERWSTGETTNVTHATVTLVAVDENGKPIPFNPPHDPQPPQPPQPE
ncbi:MAG: acyl-CoA thioesterase YciA [Phycisphaerales bacterium]|jgi:acyl-CoA thioesterase YciA